MASTLKSKYSILKKTLIGVGAFFALAAFVGGGTPSQEDTSKELVQQSSAHVKSESTSDETKKKKTKTETKMIEETEAIPYQKVSQNDASLSQGQRILATKGADGSKVIVYEVTYTDGKETGRTKISEDITKRPVTQVTKVGTKVAVAPPASTPRPAANPAPKPKPKNCSPNYSGCVPIAFDVDCAGGSGNGPAYVSGPIRVIGPDIYRLDANHNGIACE